LKTARRKDTYCTVYTVSWIRNKLLGFNLETYSGSGSGPDPKSRLR
jgi:hypothetical protein